MQQLLQLEGVDVNLPNAVGSNALHIAAKQGHSDLMRQLLQRESVKVNALDKADSASALQIAAGQGHSAVMRQLLQIDKVLVNAHNAKHYGASSLLIVAYHGHRETLKLLLQNKRVEACSINRWGQNALHVAAAHGCSGAVDELLNCAKFAGSVNAKDLQEFTALHYAATKGHVVVVNRLLNSIHKRTLLAKSR
eukprot:1387519-Amphidinium_carterae.1